MLDAILHPWVQKEHRQRAASKKRLRAGPEGSRLAPPLVSTTTWSRLRQSSGGLDDMWSKMMSRILVCALSMGGGASLFLSAACSDQAPNGTFLPAPAPGLGDGPSAAGGGMGAAGLAAGVGGTGTSAGAGAVSNGGGDGGGAGMAGGAPGAGAGGGRGSGGPEFHPHAD